MKTLLIQSILALTLTVCARADLAPLPRPATSFGAAVSEGWLYVYGGNTGKAHEFHSGCIKGDFLRLQLPDGKQWEALPAGPALLSPALVAWRGEVIRIGGLAARNRKGEPNDLHSTDAVARFDPQSRAWTALPRLPQARSSHDAAIVGDLLYVGGGWKLDGPGEEEWHRTMLTLDLTKPEKGWTERPQPFARRALAMAALGKRIWFLGGMNEDNQPARDVDWFDTESGQWGKGPQLPDGPVKGFGVAACAESGQLYASPLSGDIFALNAQENGWREAAKLRAPRYFHRLLPVGAGRLVAVGGSNRQHQIQELELVSVAAGAPAAAKGGSGGSWSQWRGPHRDGISPETGWRKDWPQSGPPLLWRSNVGKGMSSPVLAEGKVILHGNDGEGMDHVRALEAATGKELWQDTFPCASQPHEMPIVPPGPCATPTIDPAAGMVFVLSREGELRCLELASGKLMWRKDLIRDLGGKRPVYGYAQSPLLVDGKVILDIGKAKGETGSNVALEAASGAVVWKAGTGEAGYSSARVLEREGKKWVIMLKGEGLVVLDAATGETNCTYATSATDFSNAATPVLVGNRVLVSNTGFDPAALLEWKPGDPEMQRVWTQKQFALLFNTAIEKDGCLFAFNEKRRGHNEFTCLDEATGESRWVSDAIGTGTFILSDGYWIFLTREGEVVLAPASVKELKAAARFPAVEGKCYATPALAEGRLFVRSNAGEVAAFDLR